ncbi:MAG: LysM peptidoglycan-binding domain-containing protein [Herbinix sp.]|nr:LysM peptidoglycan-binding domain-containing protein [Herbinix sp.]
MIETIYSNDNGEGDKSRQTGTSFKMPKNIRQVGKSNINKKIYVEDYVMTFIKQLAGGDYAGCSIAVLVGQCIKIENCRNIFISGAVEVNGIDTVNDIVFTNDTWTTIYEDIKKYFVETEIVGWFIGGPGYLLSEEEKILKTHVDNFAGQDKILLTYDNMEKEETFLSYENNRLCSQDGYYIYYEKNEEMQTYIIDHKKSQSSDEGYDDKISKDIRTVIQNKKPPEEDSKNITKLIYAAGTLLAVIVLIVGAAMLRNYDQMKSMQNTLNYLSKNMEEVQAIFADSDTTAETDTAAEKDTTSKKDASTETSTNSVTEGQAAITQGALEDASVTEEGNLEVEVVSGNVKPLAEDKSQSDSEDSKDSGTVSDKELAEKATVTEAPAKKDTKTSEVTKDTSQKKASSDTAKKEVNYYTVGTGDTLADISYKLYKTYTKVDRIMELNGIEDQDLIYVGQKLIVP